MQESLDAMKLSLRVLSALNEKRDPDPTDVEQLRALAPFVADLPPDELACEVISRALQHRAHVRAALGRG
jgi:hypothetical protein